MCESACEGGGSNIFIFSLYFALLGYTSPPPWGSVASPLQWLFLELAIKYACRLNQAVEIDISIEPKADGKDHTVSNPLRLFLHLPTQLLKSHLTPGPLPATPAHVFLPSRSLLFCI